MLAKFIEFRKCVVLVVVVAAAAAVAAAAVVVVVVVVIVKIFNPRPLLVTRSGMYVY